MREKVRIVPSMLLCCLLGTAFGFEWTPGEFPGGDQQYRLEIRFGEDEAGQRATLDIEIEERGEGYGISTILTTQRQVENGELDLDSLGGGAFGLAAFGPALMFGPTFMLLPLMLDDQDIRVRSEPIVVMGAGQLHMDRTEQVAGHECVVVRFEPSNNPEGALEFALAEGVPFPCFSRHGSGGQRMEIRLLEAR